MNRHIRQNFQKKIWNWYFINTPNLPWRNTKNPYHIFVSEVMLQQTQIPRVLEKYPLFLKRFPNIQTLATTNLAAVLITWQGMGYNRRGLYLKKSAEIIMQAYDCRVPKNEDALCSLPGIGIYSARAILCFAHGICKPFIETNIRRVIIHEFFPRKKMVSDADIYAVLEKIQPEKNTREWYYALMDYGRDALKHIPNPNRNSKHYTKQSKFEGSTRYVRAKIITYLLKNKKATEEALFLSLIKDPHLKKISLTTVKIALDSLKNENIITISRDRFQIF
jgi:A/G-specific adenine glycosylase